MDIVRLRLPGPKSRPEDLGIRPDMAALNLGVVSPHFATEKLSIKLVRLTGTSGSGTDCSRPVKKFPEPESH